MEEINIINQHKKCTKCCKNKCLLDFAIRTKNKKDGRDFTCKQCKSEQIANYYKENPEKLKKSIKKWRSENKEREKIRLKIYRNNNKEKMNLASENWKKRNPEKVSERISKYYIANINNKKDNAKKYYLLNKETIIENRKKWYINNTEKAQSFHRKWKEKNPHMVCAIIAKRRAFKKNATPKWLMLEHIKQINAFYAFAKKLENKYDKKFHVDHIVPLQNDLVCGLHVPWNLQVLPARDNIKKGNGLYHGD